MLEGRGTGRQGFPSAGSGEPAQARVNLVDQRGNVVIAVPTFVVYVFYTTSPYAARKGI